MKEPSYSCPEFDEAIEYIERTRKINSELRDWGNYWKDKFSDLEEEMEKELKYMEKQHDYKIEELQQQIDNLEYQLKTKE